MPWNAAETLPREFRDFRGYHAGKSVLVCGCGASLSTLAAPEKTISIGVNDVGRLIDPDYLVVLNPPHQFAADRFAFVRKSRARCIFTQLDCNFDHPHVVRFRLGTRGGADLSNPEALPYTQNSPYVAIALAMHVGAKHIGVIGVDFTENHFFAHTGKHLLNAHVTQIDAEYQRLYDACRRAGTAIFNLSRESRLTAFPRITQEEFARLSLPRGEFVDRKIFFVNFTFKNCGSVFSDGLAQAANDLGVNWKATLWNDPLLPQQVEAFRPDLLFVVHGRKFSAQWPTRFERGKSAVWLLDEPYEVDDTARFSKRFDTVLVNDSSTLSQHHNAHYVPTCCCPSMHTYLAAEERPFPAGFVGQSDPQREEALARLARRGFLSYVAGFPWRNPATGSLCRAANLSPRETASLYRQTRIVVNLFRNRHQYNRGAIRPSSLNPRIYEALGCGALVISEHRSELDSVFPELPVFHSPDELESQMERYLLDQDLYARTRKACIRRVAAHCYSHRLHTALKAAFETESQTNEVIMLRLQPSNNLEDNHIPAETQALLPPELEPDWESLGNHVEPLPNGQIEVRNASPQGSHSEVGLHGRNKLGSVVLEFEVFLQSNSRFIAKIHQQTAKNQLTNSYHVICFGQRAYLARHNQIFCRFTLPLGVWVPLLISYHEASIVVRRDGKEIARACDRMLEAGYCFLGVIDGEASLRRIRVTTPQIAATEPDRKSLARVSAGAAEGSPTVSIVTTVYDRVDCLERCIQSVQALSFSNFEHIIVADCPPLPVADRIRSLVEKYTAAGYTRLSFLNLGVRHNDWGIAPAAAGLAIARGKYVCFLSDDNGYLPHHLDKLVAALETQPDLGFVYSSCLYAGRGVLNSPAPRSARIDLGQPLFRRAIFEVHLGGTLPFHEYGWDWRMIERFMTHGVRWQHIDDATFIFRLAQYPQLMPPNAAPVPKTQISYCIACFRPVYAHHLIDELIQKTTVPAEILLWMNVADMSFEQFVADRTASGANIRVLGRTPMNIGIAAYRELFDASSSDMVAQVDDDVVCISPRIAETARTIFDRFPSVGMLTADVWQDEFTTGARPPMEQYREYSREFGLHDGPIDGWFAVYRRSSLALCSRIQPARYSYLGCAIKAHLKSHGQDALLCTGMRVFHVTGPAYASHFGMLESEIAKYRMLGRRDMVAFYSQCKLPAPLVLSAKVEQIKKGLGEVPSQGIH